MSTEGFSGIPAARKGRFQRVSHGAGRINGNAVRQATGRVNGLGPSGRGRVNGALPTRSIRQNPFGVVTVRDVRTGYVLLAATVILVPLAAFLFTPELDRSPVTTNGNLVDWVSLYDNPAPSPIARFGHAVHAGRAYFAVETRAEVFPDPTGLDGVYVFLDADADPSTGYSISGVGADAMIRVSGGAGAVDGSGLWRWMGSDPADWSRWGATGAVVVAAVSGSGLEVEVGMESLDLGPDYRVLLTWTDFEGALSSSAVTIGPTFGALRIDQTSLTSAIAGGSTPLLELRLSSFGSAVQVDQLGFGTLSPPQLAVVPPPLPITVPAGGVVTVQVRVDASSLPSGTLVNLGLGGVTADRPVTVQGREARAYVGGVPTGKRADGIFLDWADPADRQPDVTGETAAAGDLDAWGTHATPTEFLFYVETLGDILTGSAIPERVRREAGPSGGSQASSPAGPLPAKRGQDVLRVFIDEDPGAMTGAWVHGLYADYMMEALGKQGRVRHTAAYSWAGGWTPLSSSPSFFLQDREGEGSFLLPAALPATALVVIESTPWEGQVDTTEPATTRGTRGGSVPMPTASSPPSWPSTWTLSATDPDEGVADTTMEILEVRVYHDWGPYVFLRFVVEGSSPVLTDNSWWLYIDFSASMGSNDWLIEEKPSGSGGVCSYGWDTTNSDWGTGGGGCDVTDSLTDADVGSAARTVGSCYGSNGCVDLALEVSDYSGFPAVFWTTLAADATEDLDLLGNATRNPRDTGGSPCDADTGFGECVEPVQIPEFPVPLVAAIAIAPIVLRNIRGRGRGRR